MADQSRKSSCRRLFIRTLAPHVGFASRCAITMIARTALDRVGIEGCAHRGAHIFRHSLATELLRSGATLTEIGKLLRHESHDTTRIYAKVDIETLRTLSLPWPALAPPYRRREPVHAAAHIGHTGRQPDTSPGWRRDHPPMPSALDAKSPD